jgi:hypothetical protein
MIMNRSLVLAIAVLTVATTVSPAPATPFCPGKSESCEAAREAQNLPSAAERKVATKCAECWRYCWATGRSVGGFCESKCVDILAKLPDFH